MKAIRMKNLEKLNEINGTAPRVRTGMCIHIISYHMV